MAEKRWEKIYYINTNQKNTGVVALISNKENFRTKNNLSKKEGHFIMLKGSIHPKDITVLNIYIPTNRASKYMKQKLIEL